VKKLLLILCFLMIPYHNAFALAPHPLYFTIDGRPSEITVNVDGKDYVVKWDGKALYLMNAGPSGNGDGPKTPTNRLRGPKKANGHESPRINGYGHFGSNEYWDGIYPPVPNDRLPEGSGLGCMLIIAALFYGFIFIYLCLYFCGFF
jgi:hypothetical protein